jgi:uncharacterized protein (DUF1778 family)
VAQFYSNRIVDSIRIETYMDRPDFELDEILDIAPNVPAPLDLYGALPYILHFERGSHMHAGTPTRAARIEARIAPESLAAVKRAAEIQGRSVSDFVVVAALDAAERTIKEAQIIQCSLADQVRIFDLLTQPPVPSEALERAFIAHGELVRESR